MPSKIKVSKTKGGTKSYDEDAETLTADETNKTYIDDIIESEEDDTEQPPEDKHEPQDDENPISESDEDKEKQDDLSDDETDKKKRPSAEDKDDDDVEYQDDFADELGQSDDNTKDRNLIYSDVVDDAIFDDDTIIKDKRVVSSENRITRAVLTKYERVRILSERRKQLILGAKPMIKVSHVDNISEKEIASLELKNKVIPFIIIRTLPNGDIEHWKINELEIGN